jgi:hypothetical protein
MTCSWSAKPFVQYVHTRDQHTEDQDTKIKTPRPRQSLPIFWLSLNDARRDCASERSCHHDKPDNPEGCRSPQAFFAMSHTLWLWQAVYCTLKLRSIQSNSGVAASANVGLGSDSRLAISAASASRPPARGALDRAATASRRLAHREITNRLRTPRPPKSLPICNMAWTKLCANVGAAQAVPTSTR